MSKLKLIQDVRSMFAKKVEYCIRVQGDIRYRGKVITEEQLSKLRKRPRVELRMIDIVPASLSGKLDKGQSGT